MGSDASRGLGPNGLAQEERTDLRGTRWVVQHIDLRQRFESLSLTITDYYQISTGFLLDGLTFIITVDEV